MLQPVAVGGGLQNAGISTAACSAHSLHKQIVKHNITLCVEHCSSCPHCAEHKEELIISVLSLPLMRQLIQAAVTTAVSGLITEVCLPVKQLGAAKPSKCGGRASKSTMQLRSQYSLLYTAIINL
jgi:hypothetical protein